MSESEHDWLKKHEKIKAEVTELVSMQNPADVAARLRELAQAAWNMDRSSSPRDLINERTR